MTFRTGRWAPIEERRLRDFKSRGFSSQMIVPFLLRSESAIEEKWKYMNLDETQREDRRQGLRRRRIREGIQSTRVVSKEDRVVKFERPCLDLLRERDRRLALPPVSLTAELCGDPLPGYSALDRKMREVRA